MFRIEEGEKIKQWKVVAVIMFGMFVKEIPFLSFGLFGFAYLFYRYKKGVLDQYSKRLGFILQHFKILLEPAKEIRKKISNSYTLLDPSLPKSGKYYSEWKIVDNVGIENILNSIET